MDNLSISFCEVMQHLQEAESDRSLNKLGTGSLPAENNRYMGEILEKPMAVRTAIAATRARAMDIRIVNLP